MSKKVSTSPIKDGDVIHYQGKDFPFKNGTATIEIEWHYSKNDMIRFARKIYYKYNCTGKEPDEQTLKEFELEAGNLLEKH